MSTAERTVFTDTSYASGGIAISVALLSWALTTAGLDAPTAGAVATGGGSLAAARLLRLQERRRSKAETVRELLWGELHERPLTVTVLVASLIAFFEFLTGAAIGFIVLVAGTAMDVNDELTNIALLEVVGFVALPVLFFVTVPCTRFAFHRIRKNRLMWAAFALLLARVFSLLTFVAFGRQAFELIDLDIATILLGQIVVLAVMSLAALLGYVWARRTSDRYQVSILFQRLSPEDRQSMVDLLREHLT